MAKEARARSSAIDAADVTAALARRELVQHGARSVAFAEGRITTRQSVGKAAQMQAGGRAQPKFQKQGKGKSPGKNGKAKAKNAHSIVFKTVPSAEGIVSGLKEGSSASNSVTSEPSVSLSLGVQ